MSDSGRNLGDCRHGQLKRTCGWCGIENLEVEREIERLREAAWKVVGTHGMENSIEELEAALAAPAAEDAG